MHLVENVDMLGANCQEFPGGYPKATIDEVIVNKKLTVTASTVVDMGANPIKKVGAPVDAADARALLAQPGLAAACRELAEVAESRFQAAETIIQACERRAVRPAAIMKAVYRDILVSLRRRGWERLSEPLPRSKLRKYSLVARSLLFA